MEYFNSVFVEETTQLLVEVTKKIITLPLYNNKGKIAGFYKNGQFYDDQRQLVAFLAKNDGIWSYSKKWLGTLIDQVVYDTDGLVIFRTNAIAKVYKKGPVNAPTRPTVKSGRRMKLVSIPSVRSRISRFTSSFASSHDFFEL